MDVHPEKRRRPPRAARRSPRRSKPYPPIHLVPWECRPHGRGRASRSASQTCR